MTTRTLPTHPSTDLFALGLRSDGRPIWPVLGGSEGAPEPGPTGNGGDPGAGTNGGPQPPGTFTQADVDRIVSDRLARERAKYADYDDMKTKATEFDKITEAQKTAAQKQQDALEEALGKASRTEVELWKERAARRYRLDEDLLQFLGGETEAEVDERAKTLAEKIRTDAQGATAGPRRPAPDPSQGRGTGKGGAGGSVAAGRDLYQQRHGAKKT